jgi:competence protein ComEC
MTLIGVLIDKQTTALNSLGLALLVILTIDPHMSREIGFQLSFATTVAILLFYRPTQYFLNDLFPKRKLQEVIEMNGLNQHAYCLLAFLRESLALSLAVNLFALPLTLFHFQQFPWMSLLYNLFFPVLATGSLCLLLIGMLLTGFPFLASWVHTINDTYTYYLLQMTYQIPQELDVYLTADPIHYGWVLAYLCLGVLGGILWWGREKKGEDVFQFI